MSLFRKVSLPAFPLHLGTECVYSENSRSRSSSAVPFPDRFSRCSAVRAFSWFPLLPEPTGKSKMPGSRDGSCIRASSCRGVQTIGSTLQNRFSIPQGRMGLWVSKKEKDPALAERVRDRDGASEDRGQVREVTASVETADIRNPIRGVCPAVRKSARGVAGPCTENKR